MAFDFKSINPYNDEVLKQFSRDTDARVEAVLDETLKRKRAWAEVPLEARQEKIKDWQREFERLANTDTPLWDRISLEMGKPVSQSRSEFEKVLKLFDYICRQNEIQKFESSFPSVHVLPWPGLILNIMPWNFPVWQIFRAILPQLVVGNGVVIKPSEQTLWAVEVIEHALAKLPEIPVGFLKTNRDQVERLLKDQRVQGVSLTGGVETGRAIGRILGSRCIPTVYELGGQDPAILVDESEMENFCKESVKSRMQNTGQSCIATKKLLVPRRLLDQTLEIVTEMFLKLDFGDPLSNPSYGPVSSKRQWDKLSQDLAAALLDKRFERVHQKKNCGTNHFGPTLLAYRGSHREALRSRTLNSIEFFGPVLMAVGYDTIDEAIELVNTPEFGLGAAIYGSDPEALRQMARRLEVGMVSLNSMLVSQLDLPFGGVKSSGHGRESGLLGMLSFANVQSCR